jgi:hypothetical protein
MDCVERYYDTIRLIVQSRGSAVGLINTIRRVFVADSLEPPNYRHMSIINTNRENPRQASVKCNIRETFTMNC